MGGGSLGKNKSSSTSSSQDRVWGPQQGYLRNLYGQAENLYNQTNNAVGPAAQGLAGGILGGLGGFASPTSNPAYQNLLARAQGGSPYLQQQIQGLGQDLGDFYRNQLLPGIQSSAGLAGQFGGSRQQIAAGQAGDSIARQFQQGATALRQADYGQGLQAAQALGGLSNDYLGQMGNIYQMGMNPFNAAWMPLQQFASIVGPPTVLGSSQGRQRSWGFDTSGYFLGGGGN